MDVAVTVVAAFGGGLAGAILQPVAEHLLSSRRAADERRRADRRDARELVEAEVRQADIQHEFARRSQYVLTDDPSPEEKLQQLQQRIQAVWENVRIRPVLLRDDKLERDLDELQNVVWDLVYDARSLLQEGPREERLTPEKSKERFKRYRELRTAILERLDELDW